MAVSAWCDLPDNRSPVALSTRPVYCPRPVYLSGDDGEGYVAGVIHVVEDGLEGGLAFLAGGGGDDAAGVGIAVEAGEVAA